MIQRTFQLKNLAIRNIKINESKKLFTYKEHLL